MQGWKVSSRCSSDGCVGVGRAFKSPLSVTNGGCVQVDALHTSSLSFSNGQCVQIGARRTSSRSGPTGGNCVEVGAEPLTSSRSHANGNCVEISMGVPRQPTVILVTDTKDPDAEPVEFTPRAYQEFINRVKAGEFPVQDDVDEYLIGHHVYTRAEWEAFTEGTKLPCHCEQNCGLNEFDVPAGLLVSA